MSDNEEKFEEWNSSFSKLKSYHDALLNDAVDTSVDESDTIEETLAENYTKLGVIAEGGLKIVYRMRDEKVGRTVAMAKLKPELNTATFRERFLREARLLGNLEHGNIVPLYEIGFDKKNEPYFTMKYLEGETLATIIKDLKAGKPESKKKYDLNTLLEIFCSICNGVMYAHEKSVAHLDLKPENVIITNFDEVLIVDWGFSKNIGASDPTENICISNNYVPILATVTRVGKINGTPGYMSPEQANGETENISFASDIYSLGCILHSIITLNRPFEGSSVDEIINYTKEGLQPLYPSDTDRVRTSAPLQSIANKAMSLRIEDRYTDADLLKNEIRRYQKGFATIAEKPGPITIIKLCVIRNKKVIIQSSAIFAVILAILFGAHSLVEKYREKTLTIATETSKTIAATDAIIKKTLLKESVLRNDFKFKDAIKLYTDLQEKGYNDHRIWRQLALLHLGELNLKDALYAISQIAYEDTNKNSDLFISHTKPERTPWWEVNLGASYNINHVKIHNRTKHMDRLSNFYVFISKAPLNSNKVSKLKEQSVAWYQYPDSTDGINTFTIPFQDQEAQYIRVFLDGKSRPLHMAGVEVFDQQQRNVALNKPSHQSSTHSRHHAGVANMGGPDLGLKAQIENLLNQSQEKQIHTLLSSEIYSETVPQIFWTINSNSQTNLDDRLKTVKTFLYDFNKVDRETFNFKYTLEDDRINLDLSNNTTLNNITPLIGLPINSLNVENTNLKLYNNHFFKKFIPKINLSNTLVNMNQSFLANHKFTELIAKNTQITSSVFVDNNRLVHLNIEGAILSMNNFSGHSNSLEYLNVANTRFTSFNDLNKFKNLKTLVIDKSMTVPHNIKRKLVANGLTIQVK